jgi:hypothetical protein
VRGGAVCREVRDKETGFDAYTRGMRTILAISIASAALLVTACKSTDKSADPAGSGEITSTAAAMRLEIGGQLVTVGAHNVEVRVFDDGHAEALVLDARGKAISEPEKAKLTLQANAKGTPNARAAIDLAYEPTTARFAGKAAGKVDLEPGAIDVDLKLGDAIAQGKLDAPVLLVGPELGGTLFVAGKYGVEMTVRADGTVDAIVRDAAGVKVSGDAGMKMQAKLAAAGGATTNVALAWDTPKARFTGKADAAAKLAGGPAEISIDGAVAAKLPTLALRAEAAHGGRVIVAGNYSVELVAKGDIMTAFVFDASGASVAKGDIDLAMRIGNGAFVKLTWDAPNLSYKADIDGKVDFAMAPIAVALKVDAKAFVGASIPRVDVSADAKAVANVDAKAKVDANASAKAKADANAKVNVKAPTVQANAAIKPVSVTKSASASGGTGAGAGGTAKAGFSLGTK